MLTLLNAAGVDYPKQYRGISFAIGRVSMLPYLRDSISRADRPLFWQHEHMPRFVLEIGSWLRTMIGVIQSFGNFIISHWIVVKRRMLPVSILNELSNAPQWTSFADGGW